jgi:pyruvate, water dikinase
MTVPVAGFVAWFDDIGAADVATVGGKGASLGELTSAGIDVPPGCVVTTRAFEHAIEVLDPDGTLRSRIEALDPDDLTTVEQVTATLRERIVGAAVADDVDAAVVAAYDRLRPPSGDEPAVAVRSSATAEDGADASFAGLQDTYLWVRGGPSVVDHVRRCWASLYSVESVTYRRRRGIPEADLAMAVVIQQMVDARYSGVMFTCSPTSGDRSVIAIEASWGLGSAMVSGEVTPDTLVVNKITGEVVRRETATKTRRHRMDPSGVGVLEEDVPAELRDVPCLDDDRVAELVTVAKRVERHYGCPQDIEWALPDGGDAVLLLQSRPETTWATREREPAARPAARPFDHVLGLLGGTPTAGDQG